MLRYDPRASEGVHTLTRLEIDPLQKVCVWKKLSRPLIPLKNMT